MPLWRLLVPNVVLCVGLMLTDPVPPLERLTFWDLDGWPIDDLEDALAAFRLSCREILDGGRSFERPVRFGGKHRHWSSACKQLSNTTSARAFFETNFVPFKVHDPDRAEGLFTGYYEPEVEGSRTPNEIYSVPIYRRPLDLVPLDEQQQKATGLSYGRLHRGKPAPYFTRQEIEAGALRGRGLELLWLRDRVDAFFMQVQGSGRVRRQDGATVRLSYSAKSGLPYTSIGGILVSRGVFSPEDVSMQAIRRWMADNPESAQKLMWENKSFVFFREIRLEDPSLGPIGAQHVQLTPGRSLAVDRNQWAFGMPVWLETARPTGVARATEVFHRLMIAQDTGTAIKGLARGDVFWGSGEEAARVAGHMKSPGTMIVLLPVELARDEGLLE